MTSGPVRVRAATAEDVPAVVTLEDLCFADPWGVDSVRHEVAATDRVVRVAESTGTHLVVGWSSTQVVGDTADLLRVAVGPSARRSGTGRLLVTTLLADAADRGADRVLLEVAETNVAARGLYAALGFAEIHRRRAYYADGGDALVLERHLATA